MKRLKLIYNPNSGSTNFKFDLDIVIEQFQKGGYQVSIHRSHSRADIISHLSKVKDEQLDALVISGGDGSINACVNGMILNEINVPLGIIPSGTANDLARFLQIPTDFVEAAKVIANGEKTFMDIGDADGKYFVNVCAAGMLTNISQNIDEHFKNTFGKLAYYIKGIEQIPNFMPMRLKIANSTSEFEEDILFYCVLNSSGTGGFDKITKDASLNDGLFEFVGFKSIPLKDLALLMVKVLAGDYLNDSGIVYFKDSFIEITPIKFYTEDEELIKSLKKTDIDGEAGPLMPIKIKNLHKRIEVFSTNGGKENGF